VTDICRLMQSRALSVLSAALAFKLAHRSHQETFEFVLYVWEQQLQGAVGLGIVDDCVRLKCLLTLFLARIAHLCQHAGAGCSIFWYDVVWGDLITFGSPNQFTIRVLTYSPLYLPAGAC
jgi:hypothetical protein